MNEQPILSPKLIRFFPLAIFLFGLMIRIWGVGWGLPNDLHHQSYHPDEEVIWQVSRQIEPTKGDFAPSFYNYGTLYLSVLRVASDMTAAYVGVDEKEPWKFVAACHSAGRIINTILGSLSATLIFLILRRRLSLLGATVGALALAIAPAFVVHSRFQTTDVFATFLLILGTWLAFSLVPDSNVQEGDNAAEPKSRWTSLQVMSLAGFVIGLSAGTKYTGVLGVLSLIVIGLSCVPKVDRFKVCSTAIFTPFLGFLVATPGFLLEPEIFKKDFTYEMFHTRTGHGLVFEGLSGFGYTLSNYIEGFGFAILLFGIAGIVWACRNKEIWILSMLAFAIPYFLLIGRAEVLFMRYTFPLYIVAACGVGYFVSQTDAKGGKWRLITGLALLALGNSLLNTAKYSLVMAGPEARDVVAKSLKERGKSDPNVSVGLVSDPWFWSPPFFPNSTIMRARTIPALQEMAQLENPRVVRYMPENPNDRFDWDVRLLTDLQPTYVVFSNYEVGPVARLSKSVALEGIPKLLVDRFREFHQVLLKGYVLEGVENPSQDPSQLYRSAYGTPEDMRYVSPELWVWKRK